MRRPPILSIGLVLLLLAAVAQAGSIPVPNGDFENDPLADGAFNFSTTAWTSFGGVGFGAGAFNPTTAQYAGETPNGDNVGWMIASNTAGLLQTLGATYQAGYTYTLTALVGHRDDYSNADFTLSLFAGGVSVAASGSPAPPEGGFVRVTTVFDADETVDGVAIEIRLCAATSSDIDPDQMGGGGTIVDYDDVTLDSTLTTPTSVDSRPLRAIATLHPPVPNPFNPRTTVSFELVRPAIVGLRVFDATGRLVRVLVNDEDVTAGRHDVEWNGHDDQDREVASGVYFCRLVVGGSSQTVRLVLLK